MEYFGCEEAEHGGSCDFLGLFIFMDLFFEFYGFVLEEDEHSSCS